MTWLLLALYVAIVALCVWLKVRDHRQQWGCLPVFCHQCQRELVGGRDDMGFVRFNCECGWRSSWDLSGRIPVLVWPNDE